MKISFEAWFVGLCSLARKEGVEHIIINYNDIESYREGYDNGNTPEDELEVQLSYCDRGCG